MTLKEKASQLKKKIPALFLCLKDKDTPKIVKVLGFVTIAYALSPIDLIPDFIPILGYIDDLILLPALISLTLKFIPKPIWEKNLKAAQALKLRKSWKYSIPIFLFWFIILFMVSLKLFPNFEQWLHQQIGWY